MIIYEVKITDKVNSELKTKYFPSKDLARKYMKNYFNEHVTDDVVESFIDPETFDITWKDCKEEHAKITAYVLFGDPTKYFEK